MAAAPQSAWGLRWWILLAVMTSSAIHIGLFYALGDLRVSGAAGELAETAAADDTRFEQRIQLDPKLLEQNLAAIPELAPEQTLDTEMTAELPPVDQIVEHLKGEVTFSPETTTPLNIRTKALAQGDPGSAVDTISAVDMAIAGGINKKLQSSSTSDVLKTARANDDQVTIKISDKPPTGTENLKGELAAARRKGQEGLGGLGFSTIDDLMDIKTPQKGDLKAMMPSDLLFDYNSAQLREGAKTEVMKLGLLIQSWTKSLVIIEGHTDTTGDDEYNFALSKQRAEAVKNFVVNSLLIDGTRIQTRGLGETQPLENPNAPQEAQALNRRVVIRFVNP
jgi:OmpA-OmpF porin, OOP family